MTYDVTALTNPIKEQRIQRLRTRIEEEKRWLSRTKKADEIAAKDAPVHARLDSRMKELDKKDEELRRRIEKESQDFRNGRRRYHKE
jgi:molecular chaperone GrpE (heat shock protein)